MVGYIRRARFEERDRISEIRSAVHENKLGDPTAVTDAHYAWFTEHPGIWVWEEGGRILGFSAGDTRDGTIWALFVDPAHHRRGIGRALFEAALRDAAQGRPSHGAAHDRPRHAGGTVLSRRRLDHHRNQSQRRADLSISPLTPARPAG